MKCRNVTHDHGLNSDCPVYRAQAECHFVPTSPPTHTAFRREEHMISPTHAHRIVCEGRIADRSGLVGAEILRSGGRRQRTRRRHILRGSKREVDIVCSCLHNDREDQLQRELYAIKETQETDWEHSRSNLSDFFQRILVPKGLLVFRTYDFRQSGS